MISAIIEKLCATMTLGKTFYFGSSYKWWLARTPRLFINPPNTVVSPQDAVLNEIDRLDAELFQRLQSKFIIHPSLSRVLVSFQANRTRPFYHWHKLKEAFSAMLVEYSYLPRYFREDSGPVCRKWHCIVCDQCDGNAC